MTPPPRPPSVAVPRDGVGAPSWSGRWVVDRLELTVRTTASPLGLDLTDLVGLAVRRNPRRAHLLVSRVLGKHIPTDPRLVHGAGLLLGELVRRRLCHDTTVPVGLGDLVRAALAGDAGAAAALPDAVTAARGARTCEPVVVLGYAETATALGQCVAEMLDGATYVHSTRRAAPGVPAVGGFEEEHSHATSHLLAPADRDLFLRPSPVVLVDDELSTGRTTMNTISALQRLSPRDTYVIATLVDVRGDADRAAMDAHANALGTRIEVVSLAQGLVMTSPETASRGAAALAEAGGAPHPASGRPTSPGHTRRIGLSWPANVPETGRHGVGPGDTARLEDQLPGLAAALVQALGETSSGGADRRVLVLGTEELMYVPLRLACGLADALDEAWPTHPDGVGPRVRFSTTTRSPVLPVEHADYAIRSALTFPAHDDPDDGPGPRFAYNVSGAEPTHGVDTVDTVVVVTDARGDTPALTAPDGLLARLADHVPDVLLVVLPDAARSRATASGTSPLDPPHPPDRSAVDRSTPGPPPPLRGPAFGSYARDDVAWLLTDLSHVALEAPVEEREEAIQSGGAHYAESLPIEYQPTAAYTRLFDDALVAQASRVARAVGVVTEMVLAARGPNVTLVSLARAGTPIGVLMRRWAEYRHGLRPAHYAVSIVRGRGIDEVALRYLAAHHDPASVMFVDGWTGKGAIVRELSAAIDEHVARTGDAFSSELAVLADPGRCAHIFGTREDHLIPSACLNATVSGLISRTVLNPTLIGPGEYHGAKFYAELGPADVSATFIDAVVSRFDAVAADVEHDRTGLLATDREPTWSGWAAVERIAAQYGITDLNLVKPGVGETTRVLLRRVPWRVLVNPDADVDLSHVIQLADERGVTVERAPGIVYSCVGLIHPEYTRGATGVSGTAVTSAGGVR